MEGYRQYVPFVEDDKVMYRDMEASVRFLQDVELELPEELLLFRDYAPGAGS